MINRMIVPSHGGVRARLMRSLSVIAVIGACAAPAQAQYLNGMRPGGSGMAAGGAGAGPTTGAATAGSSLTASMVSAREAATRNAARATAAIDFSKAAQTAARTAAGATAPRPGQLVVGNGLNAANGLRPAAGITPASVAALANTAARDATGIAIWQGAAYPTQTGIDGQGPVTVTVQQLESRALLSWDSFNVGRETTLVFDQKLGGVAQPDWVAVNRVVGGLNPLTGLRGPGAAPSQILGQIKADGIVVVLNQNGILFGPESQVNTRSFMASSYEIGAVGSPTRRIASTGVLEPANLSERSIAFLQDGLVQALSPLRVRIPDSNVFISDYTSGDTPIGAVTVESGARMTTTGSGFIILAAPEVTNGGYLSAPEGQVALTNSVRLTASTGAADGVNPNVRGLNLVQLRLIDQPDRTNLIRNTSSGLIEAQRGYIALQGEAILQEGTLFTSTSVSRNGSILLEGSNVRLGDASAIVLTPDTGAETIPQAPASVAAFKSSLLTITANPLFSQLDRGAQGFQLVNGRVSGTLEIGNDATIYAPSAAVDLTGNQTIVGNRALIDVGGIKDLVVPASRNTVTIGPLKRNELRDTPNYRNSFLNGATVVLDPRRTGVRADGVAWIGSPLIEAQSFYEQVGVTATELMTRGGSISFRSASGLIDGGAAAQNSLVVRPDALIDISGGWVRYTGGEIATSRLITASGQVVDIANANINDDYVGLVSPIEEAQVRWGVTDSFINPQLLAGRPVAEFVEGRDAGTLRITTGQLDLAAPIAAAAFSGTIQRNAAQVGTRRSASPAGTALNDLRYLQATPSELPAAGLLAIALLNPLPFNGGEGDIVARGGGLLLGAAAAPVDYRFTTSLSVAVDGSILRPEAGPTAVFSAARAATNILSVNQLNASGLAQFGVISDGNVVLPAGQDLFLQPGGSFTAVARGRIEIGGSITIPDGSIRLDTAELNPPTLTVGALPSAGNDPVGTTIAGQLDSARAGARDIVISGRLSTAGKWVNDLLNPEIEGGAWLDGGSIDLESASTIKTQRRVSDDPSIPDEVLVGTALDISGSIILEADALLDVSGGGYVGTDGRLDLSSRGGSVRLFNDTQYYFQQVPSPAGGQPIDVSGFASRADIVSPDAITARVSFRPDQIRGHGFGGGGRFDLTTPLLQFASDAAANPIAGATVIPFDFITTSGFGDFRLASTKTRFFTDGLADSPTRTNALAETQVYSVRPGAPLRLTQALFPSLLTVEQRGGLLGLASQGDLYGVLTPAIPDAAFDRIAANLTLGGLTELQVEAAATVGGLAGRIEGEAGARLEVFRLLNAGVIDLPGGTINQITPPDFPNVFDSARGIRSIARVSPDQPSLADFLNANPDGTITPSLLTDVNDPFVLNTNPPTKADNRAFAAISGAYFLGALDADQGIVLAADSVTDLSGTTILDPRAPVRSASDLTPVRTGRIIAGGTLSNSATGLLLTAVSNDFLTYKSASLTIQPDASVDLRGASDSFERLDGRGNYVSVPVWSDSGRIVSTNLEWLSDNVEAGKVVDSARGGTLVLVRPTLTSSAADSAAGSVVAAERIEAAGFENLEAISTITARDSTTLRLGGSFILRSDTSLGIIRQALTRTRVDAGADYTIEAAFVGFSNDRQTTGAGINFGIPFVPPPVPLPTYAATFKADTIEVRGSLLVDPSVSGFTLDARNDVRLVGVQNENTTVGGPIRISDPATFEASLRGALTALGTVTINAAQIYPTTGTSFDIDVRLGNGRLVVGRTPGTNPETPLSAGGTLNVFADTIDFGGVIRAPLGTIALGSLRGFNTNPGGEPLLAPPTRSLTIRPGAIVSTAALSTSGAELRIPYGETTDLVEYFFSPTNPNPLAAPPLASITLGGSNIAINPDSIIDTRGGGELYAYEFVSGIGGSRDVLNRFNSDLFSANDGLQYADGRQVYAILPSRQADSLAAFDPLYSRDYVSSEGGALYGANAGRRVLLDGAPGLAAGWYTLLPARYATLPGALRMVENVGATTIVGDAGTRLRDGSFVSTGYYGTTFGDKQESTQRSFTLQNAATFLNTARIVTTDASPLFESRTLRNSLPVPRLPRDAGRLAFNATDTLAIDGNLLVGAAARGRGTQFDFGGDVIVIVPQLSATPTPGVLEVTAGGLSALNAASLLIGGNRQDNADGTVTLIPTARSILVANDALNPLSAVDVILAVDGETSSIVLADDATITATGDITGTPTGDFIVAGTEKFLRNDGQFGFDPTLPENAFNTNTGSFNTRFLLIDPTFFDPSLSPEQLYVANPDPQTGRGAILEVTAGPARIVRRSSLRDRISTVDQTVDIAANARLTGKSILIDATSQVRINTEARLVADNVSIGAPNIAFADDLAGTDGFVIGAGVQALLAAAQSTTLSAPQTLDFSAGNFVFNSLRLNVAGLRARTLGAAVSIVADDVLVSNTATPLVTCTVAGAGACGTGTLAIAANTFIFGGGPTNTFGFGGGVTLGGSSGMFYEAAASFDVGDAPLVLNTPFLIDRAIGVPTGTTPVRPTLALTTTNSVIIAAPVGSSLPTTLAIGGPGAALSIAGDNITVVDSFLRATAGSLTLRARTDITASGDAGFATPGYARRFGDRDDFVDVSAPGGQLRLIAETGDIALGADTLLSIGGGSGRAGRLSLIASEGSVAFGRLDTAAPDGKASLIFDSNTGFDLARLFNGNASVFTGDVDVRAGTGDFTLAAGQTLSVERLALVAETGAVTIAGTVDTSGVNGGDIALFGGNGVTLAATGLLDTSADGYANDDTRSATAGNVTLGTAGNGAITIAQGAVIDASARRPGDRLVAETRKGFTFYSFAAGDRGGSVLFRSQLIETPGGNRVNINIADAATIRAGAREIAIEGFKRFDLAAIAADSRFTGVSRVGDAYVLDTRSGLDLASGRYTGPRANFLAGVDADGFGLAGTLPEFVQTFDISASYAGLGGLNTLPGFQARPGIELVAAGDITLASNWNLGAGTVDTAEALASGALARSLLVPIAGSLLDRNNLLYVRPGREADVIADHTVFTYRTGGGSASGAAPLLTIRASGDLRLGGSITDGFFSFADYTAPEYLNVVQGGGIRAYEPVLTPGCVGSVDCTTLVSYAQAATELRNGVPRRPYATVNFGTRTVRGGLLAQYDSPYNAAPFSALANTAAALGAGAGGAGDPLSGAQLFPRLSRAAPEDTAITSTSYRFIAGSDASVDPVRTSLANPATLSVFGETSYSHRVVGLGGNEIFAVASGGGIAFDNGVAINPDGVSDQVTGQFRPELDDERAFGYGQTRFTENDIDQAGENGFQQIVGFSSTESATVLDFTRGSAVVNALLLARAVDSIYLTDSKATFLYANGTSQPPTGVLTSIGDASRFLASISTDLSTAIVNDAAYSPNVLRLSINQLADRLLPRGEELRPLLDNISQNISAYTNQTIRYFAKTEVRTGTGSIAMSASGDVNLAGYDAAAGETPPYRATGNPTAVFEDSPGSGFYTDRPADEQIVGGPAVYTAGSLAAPGPKTARLWRSDGSSESFVVDTSAFSDRLGTVAQQQPDVRRIPYFATDPFDVDGTFADPNGSSGGFPRPLGYSRSPGSYNANGTGVRISDAFSQIAFLTNGRLVPVSTRDLIVNSPEQAFAFNAVGINGGDFAIEAGGDLLGNAAYFNEFNWRTNALEFVDNFNVDGRQNRNLAVAPTLFDGGIGSLAGGGIRADVAGRVDNIGFASVGSQQIAQILAPPAAGSTAEPTILGKALLPAGGGIVDVGAGGDLVGVQFAIGRGEARITTGGSLIDGTVPLSRSVSINPEAVPFDGNPLLYTPQQSRTIFNQILSNDATLTIEAVGAAKVATDVLDGYTSLEAIPTLTRSSELSARSGLDILANDDIMTSFGGADLRLASITADVMLLARENDAVGSNFSAVRPYLFGFEAVTPITSNVTLITSAYGGLEIFAGNTLAPVSIYMRDDELLAPFWSFADPIFANPGLGVRDNGVILPSTSDADRRLAFNPDPNFRRNLDPVRIAVGGDLDGVLLRLPKEARIDAGRDIIDMVFIGQNLDGNDVTRVRAGRDIIATQTALSAVQIGNADQQPRPTLQGNLFVIGGPGDFYLEAGRDAGPFLNSATVISNRTVDNPEPGGEPSQVTLPFTQAFGGGILAVGNDYNRWLPAESADISVQFGLAPNGKYQGNDYFGGDYVALRETYLSPVQANLDARDDDQFVQISDSLGNRSADRSQPIYNPKLIAWVLENARAELDAAYPVVTPPGASRPLPSYADAYDVFSNKISILRQRDFLVKDVLFNEFTEIAQPDNISYLKYSRGYRAINLLFAPDKGFTANNLEGGEAGASETIETGNLDLRLATINTQQGSDISILGPGGAVLGGSVVRTEAQPSRRNSAAPSLYTAQITGFDTAAYNIINIPTGLEGIITLRGGDIFGFTDRDFILNQSRLFAQNAGGIPVGGDIALWSSNGDLNAGQGPKTSFNFPPVIYNVDNDGFFTIDAVGGVTGAGIAAFAPNPDPDAQVDVFLLAPRGEVDAGDAGVRVEGNLFVAAQSVANADNFQVSGTSIGVPQVATVDAGAQASANTVGAAINKALGSQAAEIDRASRISVTVDGFFNSDRCSAARIDRPVDCPPL